MSRAQALEVAAGLRLAAKGDGLVRVGYQPQRGIVVELVKDGRATTVRELGASSLTSPYDTLFEDRD